MNIIIEFTIDMIWILSFVLSIDSIASIIETNYWYYLNTSPTMIEEMWSI